MERPEKVNLSHIVSERIKTYILENGLRANDKLPSEKQLIEKLGVSRTVVREALKSLEMLGIVKIKTGDGIYVDSMTLKPVLDQMSFRWKLSETKMKELWDTRRVLELGAIEMAIDRYDLSIIHQMNKWNDAMEEKMKLNRIPLEEDLEFHRALFKATGNETFYDFSEVLIDFFTEIREFHYENSNETKKTVAEHRNIVKYILDRDKDAAKREMELHLLTLKRYIH